MTRLDISEEDTATVMGMRGSGKTAICRLLASGARTVVWDPLGQYPANVAYRPRAVDRAEFDALVARVWHNAPATLLVEEAEQVLPQGPPLPPNFKAFALMGRNYGLRWFLNTRSPQALAKAVLDESDHLFIFKLGGRALDYMKDYLGRTDGRELDRMRKWIKDPRKGGGRYFHYHDGELTECPRLTLPRGMTTTAGASGR
jgi:hypothetical protein